MARTVRSWAGTSPFFSSFLSCCPDVSVVIVVIRKMRPSLASRNSQFSHREYDEIVL